MDKLIFIVEEAEEGGYNARANSESIYTQGDTIEELKVNVCDAVQCHFDDGFHPDFDFKFLKKW